MKGSWVDLKGKCAETQKVSFIIHLGQIMNTLKLVIDSCQEMSKRQKAVLRMWDL